MKKQIIYFFSGALVFAVNLNALGVQNFQINRLLQQEYESWVNLGRPEISNTANYCMCRVVSPYSGNMWVASGVSFSGSACSTDCASRCASHAYTVKNADYWAHRETLGLEDAHD